MRGEEIKPSVTPDYPDQVFNILFQRIKGDNCPSDVQTPIKEFPSVTPFKLGSLISEVDIDSIAITA